MKYTIRCAIKKKRVLKRHLERSHILLQFLSLQSMLASAN